MHRRLQARLQEAVAAAIPGADVGKVRLQPCPDARFGDYQTSGLMALAKARKENPRLVVEAVLSRLDLREWCASVEAAGGGYLNFRLKDCVVRRALAGAGGDAGFDRESDNRRTVVVDFSSPNVAKPMHVGHIRSTNLGDCLARVLRQLGHRVITDNHIGDWGTQFGKLLFGWKRLLDADALERRPIDEMERLYRTVHQQSEQDPGVLEAARQELVALQAGDVVNRQIWEQMIEASRREFDAIYRRLGVRFDHTLGESYYNSRLQATVRELRDRGIARDSEGAVVVFFEGVPGLEDHPAIILKSDGAANYATTDLATLAFRVETWKPDEIVYVTDGRQQLHFRQVFATFRRWRPEVEVRLTHVWFGTILGEDGKPFRTRSGDTIRLEELLDEAEERAFAVVTGKNPSLEESTRREIARIVGLGAIKYADLLANRQSDYVFSWDKMLALNGNTAPYLQYAFTRIRSIFRKGGLEGGEGVPMEEVPASSEAGIMTPEERDLAVHLLNFAWVLEAVVDDYRPNYLCNYLYELAGRFGRFYERCPVLKADRAERQSRLTLCDASARVLKRGLDCLGIETSELM